MITNEHQQRVSEFLRSVEAEDPATYAAVCERFPVVSFRKWKRIRRREKTVGLLGLQPARISSAVAEEYGLETMYEGDEHPE